MDCCCYYCYSVSLSKAYDSQEREREREIEKREVRERERLVEVSVSVCCVGEEIVLGRRRLCCFCPILYNLCLSGRIIRRKERGRENEGGKNIERA